MFSRLDPWESIIYDALNYKEVMPPARQLLLANCNGDWLIFLYHACFLFNPDIVNNTALFLPKHPTQGKSIYEDYFHDFDFCYNMQGLVDYHHFGYSDHNIQDIFISNMNNSDTTMNKSIKNNCLLWIVRN